MQRIPPHRRIPSLLRPLRPPNLHSPLILPRLQLGRHQNPRPFTHNSSLFLVGGRVVSRPQLPFLHSSATVRPTGLGVRGQGLHLVQRLLSTERKARWKAKLRWQVRFHAYFWPASLLCVLLFAGVHQTKLEHDFPTPREWSFWSRWFLRSAVFEEVETFADLNEKGTRSGKGGREGDSAVVMVRRERNVVDWATVGFNYAMLLDRLEDGEIDGGSLLRQGDDNSGILVEGLGEVGWDVSMKSEEWRRGYHQALMGAGKCAERLEGLVKLKKGKVGGKLVERACIVGPDNPRPRPMPWGMSEVWREDEVEDAFPAPEKFYLRVLTTRGFTSAQKVDAAVAYADWCDFKGLYETGKDMLEWGLDVAIAGVQSVGKAGSVVDKATGVIDVRRAEDVSANILKVCTAMGVHWATTGDIQKALPVFLSVLRARKVLPAEPAYLQYQAEEEKRTRSGKEVGLWPYIYAMRDWFMEAPYPPRPPSGDERPYHTLAEACEEVGLMTYIGEILYATSTEREKGLSWTRDAVEAAEAVMWVMREEGREDGRERCRECLKIGLENWKNMARSMAKEARQNEKEVALNLKDIKWYDLLSNPDKEMQRARNETKRWEEEETQIELRRQKTMPLITPLRPTKMGWLSV